MFKFGEKEVCKDFYKQRQISDIFTIDVNKVVVSTKYHVIMERTGSIL